MRVSPTRTRLVAGLAAILAASAIGIASAQVGPPIRLAPGASLPPAPPAAAAQAVPDQLPPPRPSQDVTVDQLPPPNVDAQGVLGPNDRPLPADLWQGTPLDDVKALMPKIRPATSATLQDLAYRLLASPATPPDAGDAPAGALLAYRAERLTALGRPDAALGLLQSIPSPGEDVSRAIVDLAFLSGDTRTACATAHARDPAWQNPYWDQANVTCQALDGKADDAQLGLDMLREAKVKDDGFSALVLKAVGIDAKLPDSLPTPTTMSLVLLQKAGQPLPKRALDAPPAIQRAVALGDGFPPDQRLAAAEKAAAYGAISPERLAEMYLATDLNDDERQTPLTRAKAAGGAHGRAILFRAAHDAGQLVAKGNFLVSFLSDSKSELFPALLRAAGPMLVEVPATEDLKSVAPDFARALYALDQPRQAAAWLEVATPEAQAALLPLAHVVDDASAPAWPNQSVTDLAGGRKDAAATRRATAAAQLLTAEGVILPDQMLLPLADDGPATPTSGPGAQLATAAMSNHLGITLLALFATVGDQGIGAQPVLAAEAVAALRQVGLADDAHRLAIDIAIAEGI